MTYLYINLYWKYMYMHLYIQGLLKQPSGSLQCETSYFYIWGEQGPRVHTPADEVCIVANPGGSYQLDTDTI